MAKTELFNYPESSKEDILENYHGTEVNDPYRWLEDPNSEKTKKWIKEQNELTFSHLAKIPVRESIKNRLFELWNYPKYSLPHKHGKNYFFYKNHGLQNQSVLYKQHDLNSEYTELLDPNKINTEGVSALTTVTFNKEGTLLGYGVSENGSDKQIIKVKDIETGKDYPETLNWCRFSAIAWNKDSSGFYYNRFPKKGEVAPEDEGNYSKIFFHKLNTDQNEDILIYQDPKNKYLGFFPYVSEDKDYLIIHEYQGTASENNLYFKKIDSTNPIKKIFRKAKASYEYVHNEGELFFINTNESSPNHKLIAFNVNSPQKANWKTIIPESTDVIDTIKVVNNHFVVVFKHKAHHIIKVFNFEGQYINQIYLPTLGSVEDISGDKDDKEMFIRFISFTYPATSFRYHFDTHKLEEFRTSLVNFKPSDFETRQVFYPSKDGTKVSMFLSYKKGIKLDGNNPVLLYGYGGFNVSLTPNFSIARIALLEKGFVFAMPNLRGGGEYGEEWHKAGMLENKQNVFDDFISAGEWLIEHNYTKPLKLSIHGGSNGGLLVAACMTQRPDLFGAVICSVPVIDMLRYHKFTIGRYWIPEYGDAESNKDHFDFMYKYSPLHNVKNDVNYPALLITTADTDDRVVPAHAAKFASILQSSKFNKKPVFIRIETKAGHGLGKPTSKLIEEQTDMYAFLFKNLGVE